MKQRPILVAVIGYIIGILWGLYFQISIVLYYIPIAVTYKIVKTIYQRNKKYTFKLLSFSRYKRYLKLIIHSKTIFILILCSIISNTIVLFLNKKYEQAFQEDENIQVIGIVISPKIEKQYYDLYQVKLLGSKHFNLFIQVSKKIGELEYGDKVQLQGEYKKPIEQRNYGGYDDKQYLRTLKIIGRVKVHQIEIMGKKQINPILQLANQVNLKIKQKIDDTFEKEKASVLKALLLGDTSEIEEEVRESFQVSNISHVLAISGMHIGYIIIGLQLLLKKLMGKRNTKIMTIIILIIYAFLTKFSPSVVRAIIMSILTIGGEIVYRKSDFWNSIAISLLVILCYNPFLILSVGLQLSYLGTIGIILFSSTIFKMFQHIPIRLKFNRFEKVEKMLAVSLSAQITIFPVLWYYFNSMGIYFLITNLLVSFIISPIILGGFFCIIINLFAVPVEIGLNLLNLISGFSQLPFSKIYLPTPNIIGIIVYWIGLAVAQQVYRIYQAKQPTITQARVRNLIALFRYRFFQKKKKYKKFIVLVLILMVCFTFLPKDLEIHFVDVGQGDCTFMITPFNQTILVDGGGNLSDTFDVRKKDFVTIFIR